MSGTITARNLFDDLQQRLQLQWLARPEGDHGYSISQHDLAARPAAVGFLNLIHPNRIQVLGGEEIAYLRSLGKPEREAMIERMFGYRPLAIIIGDGLDVPPAIAAAAQAGESALLSSGLKAYELVNFLQYHVSLSLARHTTLHGVFMEVFTIGVLITGEPGCGKSELALELLTRGHRLVADDAPDFTQISPEIIDGACPEALRDCLEVRGLGILNVRQMFGDSAVKPKKYLRLIIRLEMHTTHGAPSVTDRLSGDTDTQSVLDLEIPRITLPVLAGRNMAVITEAAVRDFTLRMKGYDATAELIERHTRLLRRQAGSIDG